LRHESSRWPFSHHALVGAALQLQATWITNAWKAITYDYPRITTVDWLLKNIGKKDYALNSPVRVPPMHLQRTLFF
jgi:hypothetical protein